MDQKLLKQQGMAAPVISDWEVRIKGLTKGKRTCFMLETKKDSFLFITPWQHATAKSLNSMSFVKYLVNFYSCQAFPTSFAEKYTKNVCKKNTLFGKTPRTSSRFRASAAKDKSLNFITLFASIDSLKVFLT